MRAPVARYACSFHNSAERFITPTAIANSNNTHPASNQGDGRAGRDTNMNANEGATITPMLTPAE